MMLIQQNKGAKHYISIGHGHLNLLVTTSLSAGSKGIHLKKKKKVYIVFLFPMRGGGSKTRGHGPSLSQFFSLSRFT